MIPIVSPFLHFNTRRPRGLTPLNSVALIIFLTLASSVSNPEVEESDIIDLEKRYWLLKAQSRTGRFDLETFVPLVSPPIHASLSEGKMRWSCFCFICIVDVKCLQINLLKRSEQTCVRLPAFKSNPSTVSVF